MSSKLATLRKQLKNATLLICVSCCWLHKLKYYNKQNKLKKELAGLQADIKVNRGNIECWDFLRLES